MQSVRIVVDSTADIPHNLAEELGIVVVPLTVHFGEDTYVDWTELTPLEFYDLLETSPHHPYTSPPTVGQFQTAYEEILAGGQSIVSLHISSGLSETVRVAEAAKERMGGRGPIAVIDTKVVSVALGMPALEAARAAVEGKTFEEVVAAANSVAAATRANSFFAVDTLDYLVRNGRIGRAQALLGTILAIKPVLHFEDGLVAPYQKVRGDKKVIPRMIDIMKELVGAGGFTRVGIVQADCLEKAAALRAAIEGTFGARDVLLCDLGAVVGTHAGPGTVGVAFY